ncbi:MAG: 1-(5-phosphoribosyl)-5-[(5-phosphoribosylamino)methylideneamino]imidazole-4-carboxamide isomerase [Rhodospirillaceae bacterium]|jgi:phosphoribosylformimino-5-aminoimidazole carboxamide ribotide isomerase|nr:1-(5-phosphoribosyl)-5-[(5-phosphoribosylamino)methylideneamino]imidazole-4-carboxamide isomerase [Rhodospirillaceae bacterium]
MIFLPAIDLKDGQCVRLVKGEMDQATVFGDDPGAQARLFAEAGCTWLHVVDLNGAFEGRPVNGGAVDAILAATDMSIELGGGIRDLATIKMWLDKGVARVILGTVALKNPDLVRLACRDFPGRIAVGIDARDDFVAVEGWVQTSEITVLDLAKKFEDSGVAAVIYTDIERDGAMQGPNIEATIALAKSVTIPIIASGGVSSMADLRVLQDAAGDLLEGAISGRAVYDGRINVSAAVELLQGNLPGGEN